MVDRIGHLRRQMVGSRHQESRHPHLENLLQGSPLQGIRRLENLLPGSLLQGIRRRLENLLLEIRPGSLQLLAAAGHQKNDLDDNSSHTYPSLQTSRCNVCKTPTRGELSSIFLRVDESYLERVLSVH